MLLTSTLLPKATSGLHTSLACQDFRDLFQLIQTNVWTLPGTVHYDMRRSFSPFELTAWNNHLNVSFRRRRYIKNESIWQSDRAQEGTTAGCYTGGSRFETRLSLLLYRRKYYVVSLSLYIKMPLSNPSQSFYHRRSSAVWSDCQGRPTSHEHIQNTARTRIRAARRRGCRRFVQTAKTTYSSNSVVPTDFIYCNKPNIIQ